MLGRRSIMHSSPSTKMESKSSASSATPRIWCIRRRKNAVLLILMVTRLESKYRNSHKSALSRQANSPASSTTTSSSRQFPETLVDGLSSPASSSARSKLPQLVALEAERSTENVTVTVRFRPLSPREIRQGEEMTWYVDGDRNEHNPSIAYAYV